MPRLIRKPIVERLLGLARALEDSPNAHMRVIADELETAAGYIAAQDSRIAAALARGRREGIEEVLAHVVEMRERNAASLIDGLEEHRAGIALGLDCVLAYGRALTRAAEGAR